MNLAKVYYEFKEKMSRLLLIEKHVSSGEKYVSIHENTNNIRSNSSNSYYFTPKSNTIIALDYPNLRDSNLIQYFINIFL